MFAENTSERIYPEFPASEYETRNEKAKDAMEKQGIDALFLTMREDIEYFTGYICGYWLVRGISAGIGIIPRDGDPVLVLPDFMSGTAESTSWVRNFRTHPHTHSKPRDFPNLVVDTLKRMGLAEGTIGYESGPELNIDMPIVDFDKTRKDLQDARFVSGANVIWRCRSNKSPLEVERLRKANEISFKGYEKARETVKEGMTEVEIARIFKSVFVDEGADGYAPNGLGFFNIRAGPERYAMSDSIPQNRKIRKGDILVMNLGACYRGYYGHMARNAFVGNPTEKQKEIDNLVTYIKHVIPEFLAPGLRGADFQKYVNDSVAKAHLNFSGFKFITGGFPVGGICTGLNVHEHPRISVGMEESTEAGMCITMTIWMYDLKSHGGGVFAWEHPFIITETGNRPLAENHLEEETWVI